MDQQSSALHLTEGLQRLNTNDSTTSTLFSRNDSSCSVSTSFHSPSISKSLSFTKISDEALASKQHCITDELHLALSKIPSNQGQPKSFNKLTTTPTNEPFVSSKWCIILVGLPASGKSSICKNLTQQTSSHFSPEAQFKIDSFNAGHFRRKLSDFKTQTSNFFDFGNKQAKEQRETFAHIALDHLLNTLANSQIDVGIFDATNSTKERRDYIYETIKEKEIKTGIKINTVILHVKCTDPVLWRYNVEGKTSGPDYINSDHDNAVKDFVRRADLYREAFEEITEEELRLNDELIYLEIDNAGKSFSILDHGFLAKDDLIYKSLIEFVSGYYKNFGEKYIDRAKKFSI